MGIRGLTILAASGVLCAGALTIAPAAGAKTPASATKWQVVLRIPSALSAAVAPAGSSIWVFGTGVKSPHGPLFPVARHWNGHRWSAVKLPALKNSGIGCVAAKSPASVWAFTAAASQFVGHSPERVSALRLRQGRWTRAQDFRGFFTTGCNVVTPVNVWVFGGAVAGAEPPIGTWHLTGSHWKPVNTGKFVIFNASVVSASDIWATAGNVLGRTPAMEHWNGRSWQPGTSINSALPRSTTTTQVGLDDVNALSANNVWVLAEVSRRSGESFVVVHWNGHKWGRVKPGSAGYYLPTAVSDGQGGWWSLPYLTDGLAPYLLHRVNGRWVRSALPVLLEASPGDLAFTGAITRVPHTSTMLVAGTEIKTHGFGGVVLAFGRL